MKTTSPQLSKVLLTCMDRYSKSTVVQVGAHVHSHEDVLKMEKLVQDNLSEQEFLDKLKAEFPEETATIQMQ